jgi:diaminohydroxyphosphoribosylaminopyrimidine deaminase/5-amino-6-(5-phosphoribosylamino)uracil reductase
MSSAVDHRFMSRAIQLAAKGLYTTHPNPRVGCVLVKDGEVVGKGYHRRAGEPHAERNALAVAGQKARGATAYVSLEPCSHHGRTPPCSDGLIEAGVSRVVAAMQDPNPLVAGAGLNQLTAAGIEVQVGVMQAQAEALNPGFIRRMQQGLPFVRCKLAMSLDGRTAMANGESQWITSAAARQDVHRLRARSSAIMTGVGTLLADDPALDVRLSPAELGLDQDLEIPRPLRVVLDPELATPPGARMLQLPGESLILCAVFDAMKAAALKAAGARVMTVPGDRRQLDLPEVLRLLGTLQINEVLLECGATLAGAMLEQGLIDELIIYLAPHIMGDGARGLFHLPALQRMADRFAVQITDLRQVGRDIRITAKPIPST